MATDVSLVRLGRTEWQLNESQRAIVYPACPHYYPCRHPFSEFRLTRLISSLVENEEIYCDWVVVLKSGAMTLLKDLEVSARGGAPPLWLNWSEGREGVRGLCVGGFDFSDTLTSDTLACFARVYARARALRIPPPVSLRRGCIKWGCTRRSTRRRSVGGRSSRSLLPSLCLKVSCSSEINIGNNRSQKRPAENSQRASAPLLSHTKQSCRRPVLDLGLS